MSWNFNFTSRTPENGQKCRFLKNGKLLLLTKIGAFSGKMWSKTDVYYMGYIHFIHMVPVTLGNIFFKSWKKVPWHQRRPVQTSSGSNCHFCQKKWFFEQKMAFFILFLFFESFLLKVNIFHHSEPMYVVMLYVACI